MFTRLQRKKILDLIQCHESKTTGKIHVYVSSKNKSDVTLEAEKYFLKKHFDKTLHRNGVLIFINSKQRRFAVIGDKGVHEHVQQAFWDNSRDILACHLKNGDYFHGITSCIEEIGQRLVKRFPKT